MPRWWSLYGVIASAIMLIAAWHQYSTGHLNDPRYGIALSDNPRFLLGTCFYALIGLALLGLAVWNAVHKR